MTRCSGWKVEDRVFRTRLQCPLTTHTVITFVRRTNCGGSPVRPLRPPSRNLGAQALKRACASTNPPQHSLNGVRVFSVDPRQRGSSAGRLCFARRCSQGSVTAPQPTSTRLWGWLLPPPQLGEEILGPGRLEVSNFDEQPEECVFRLVSGWCVHEDCEISRSPGHRGNRAMAEYGDRERGTGSPSLPTHYTGRSPISPGRGLSLPSRWICIFS